MKYKQPHSLRDYSEDIRDRVHNALKHGMEPERFKPYYKWRVSKWSRRMYEAVDGK